MLLSIYHIQLIQQKLIFLFILAISIILVLVLISRKKRKEKFQNRFIKEHSKPPEESHENIDKEKFYHYSSASLVQNDGDERGRKFSLSKREIIIGINKTCDLIIYDDSVSIVHSKIKNLAGIFYIYDLISEDGIYLNNQRLLRPKILQIWTKFQYFVLILFFVVQE